jgi:hypothetical protein
MESRRTRVVTRQQRKALIMAMSSKCPKCGETSFETAVEEVHNCHFKLNFVRCSACGCVVGVLEHFFIGDLISRLAQKLGISLD